MAQLMRALVLGLLGLLTGRACAESIPKLDADDVCRMELKGPALPRDRGLSVDQRYARCFGDIQAAYDRLKPKWSAISETDQKRCGTGHYPDAKLYESIAYCVDRTLSERQGAQKAAEDAAEVRALPKKELRR